MARYAVYVYIGLGYKLKQKCNEYKKFEAKNRSQESTTKPVQWVQVYQQSTVGSI